MKSGWMVLRPVYRLLLAATGAIVGWLLFRYGTFGLIAYASGLAAPFCMLCASAIWALRDKADESLGIEQLSASLFKQRRADAERLRLLFLRRAAFVTLCALAAASPAVATQLSKAVWEWMVVLAGVAVGEAAYSFLLGVQWDIQLRATKDADLVRSKLAYEKRALEAVLESVKPGDKSHFPGWSDTPPQLLVPKAH